MSGPRPVVLHTSWRGRAVSAAAPSLLLGLGTYGLAAAGFRIFPFLLFVAGAVFMVIVLFDYPKYTVIGPAGVERHCVLRVERLGWDRVTALGRPGLRAMGSYRDRAEGGTRVGGRSGLVAEVRNRPYLLCDKSESRGEFDAVVAGLSAWAPECPIRASSPSDDAPPTWLYKKRRGSASDGLVDLLP